MADEAKGNLPDRSPLSPRALTRSELEALGVGTEVTLFCTRNNPAARPVVVTALGAKTFWVRPTSSSLQNEESEHHYTDSGLVPYDGGTWNDVNCVVRSEHVNELPAPRNFDPDEHYEDYGHYEELFERTE